MFTLEFIIGVAVGLGIAGIWYCIRLLLDSRSAQKTAANIFSTTSIDDPRDKQANEKVQACKNRLRLQKAVNPELLSPLVSEIPKLVREIAKIYHPDKSEPLYAPGLSQFSRALHFTAMDIADFLQTKRIGKLIDVSGNTAWKSWEVGHRISMNKGIKLLNKCYKWVRPGWQAVRYKSPWMWGYWLGSNIAIRTLQPIIIDIIARRAKELYSGQLVFSSANERNLEDL
jgi:hypothetical protein